MSHAQDVARALNAKGPNASGRWKAKCPIHKEKKGESLSFNKDCFRCHGAKCRAKGHISELMRHLGMAVERGAPNGDSAAEAYRLLEVQAGHKKKTLDLYGIVHKNNSWVHPYPGGAYKVKNIDPKGFYWQGTEDQIKRRTLFGLEVAKSFGGSTLHVVEGEKDVVTMGQCQIPAVCFPNGCASVPTTTAAQAIGTSGFTNVRVIYDRDDGGEDGQQDHTHARPPEGVDGSLEGHSDPTGAHQTQDGRFADVDLPAVDAHAGHGR